MMSTYIYMFFPCLCIHVHTCRYIYRYIHMCSHMCLYRSQYFYIFIFRPVKVSQKVIHICIYIYIIMKVWCCFLSVGLFSSKTLVNIIRVYTYTCISDRFLYVYIHICGNIQKLYMCIYISSVIYIYIYINK